MDSGNTKDKVDRALKSTKQFALFGGVAMVFGVALFTVGILNISYENDQISKKNDQISKENDQLYQKYVYCPIVKGRPGERVSDVRDICFRNLKTSGDVGVFLSSTNFQLDKGVEAFRQGKYDKAIQLFEQAIDGDPTDPVPWIFLNNAKARQRSNSLKLAVVASVDYYEIAAREVLRGVADAQDEFNKNQGNRAPLMEIVIANDENVPEAARQVAKELVKDPKILGIIGHHASESTMAAEKIYEDKKIAVVSPTSSSGKLTGEQFFRTVGGTKKSAEKYADYVRNRLGLDRIVVFYKSKSAYSENLKEDFKEAFSNKGGQILEYIDIGSDNFETETKVKKVVDDYKIKAALIISNVKTNSIAIAINRKNASLPPNKKMQLLGAMSLSEAETLDKGGEAVKGMILVRPCLSPQAKYMKEAAQRWNQQEINWRTAASYDATQAFAKALNFSKTKIREDILRQLQAPSFSLRKEETSGFGLKWDLSDRSNANRKYCVVQIQDVKSVGKFVDIEPKNISVKQK